MPYDVFSIGFTVAASKPKPERVETRGRKKLEFPPEVVAAILDPSNSYRALRKTFLVSHGTIYRIRKAAK